MSKKRKHVEERDEEMVVEAGGLLKQLLKLTFGLVMYKLRFRKKFPDAPKLSWVPRKQAESEKVLSNNQENK